jgi:hypothetical protein
MLSLLVGVAAGQAAPAAQPATATLTVTATYTGPGPVDESHPIWVFVFDTDSIAPDARPVAWKSISKNGASVTLEATGTVYVRTAYAEQAGYDPTAARPTGFPIGMFTKDGKTATAVTVAPGTKVTVTFDDRVRLP